MKPEELYRIAIDTRNLEINLFWQRSNYFLVLNTAIAVGFFSVKEPYYQWALSVFGIVISFLWFRVNLGSKYWQSRWEHRASCIEKVINSNIEMFSASKEVIDRDVCYSLLNHKKRDKPTMFDKAILSKPSVSFAMTLLSIIFIFLWTILLGISFGK